MNLRVESETSAPARKRVTGPTVAKLRPPEVRCRHHETPMAALRRAWESRIAFLQRHHASGVLATESEIHLLRLTVKRLRGYLQLVRPIVSDAAYREENHTLRDAARGLAGSRDHTVALRTMRRLKEGGADGAARMALTRAKRAMEESGISPGVINGRTTAAEATGEAMAVLDASYGYMARIRPLATGWAEIEGGLFHTYRRARNRFRRWRKTSDPAQGHDCRKYAKYLLFQLQLLEPMNPTGIGKRCRRLARLECRLGKLNDLVALDGRLAAERESGRVSAAVHGAVRREAERAARKLGRASGKIGGKLFRKRPEDFVRGLEKDWRRWKAAPASRMGAAGTVRRDGRSGR